MSSTQFPITNPPTSKPPTSNPPTSNPPTSSPTTRPTTQPTTQPTTRPTTGPAPIQAPMHCDYGTLSNQVCISPSSDRVTCANGYIYNNSMKGCILAPVCPPFSKWNVSLNKCDGNIEQTCPDGTTMDGTQCKSDPIIGNCPSGTVPGGTGMNKKCYKCPDKYTNGSETNMQNNKYICIVRLPSNNRCKVGNKSMVYATDFGELSSGKVSSCNSTPIAY